MKYFKLTLGTALILFILGFISGYYLLKLTETFLGIKTIAITQWDSLTPNFSLGFLLGFCSLSAGVILWAYGKSQLPHHPIFIFGLGLLASIISATISISLKLIQLQLVFSRLETDFGNNPLPAPISTGGINYFSWGFGTVFFISAITTISLLWIARKNENGLVIFSGTSKKRDIILILSTFVIFAGALINLVGFMCSMALL
jgi:hypothetical protein